MCALKWFYLICFLLYYFMDKETSAYKWTCGIDNSPSSRVYVGIAEISTYPWMGMLYYPIGRTRFTTAIVLVTKQMVIASALEIEKFPKHNFRRVARVVIGRNCKHEGVRIRDYNYHPDFSNNIFSAIAMVQLEDIGVADLTPICPPPGFFIEPEFFAMTVTEKCKTARVKIYKMEHVAMNECREFYRRTDLDVKSFWPSHTVCARSSSGGKCLWRSGTALVIKQGMHWRLLGFGVYGPGCQDPARFIDYGMYQEWVYNSVARIGRTAITRLAPNHLVMRRKMSSVQRFGPCDREETKVELYTDIVKIFGQSAHSRAVYNLSLYASYEYSCIVFSAEKFKPSYEPTKIDVTSKKNGKKKTALMKNPQIYLRRWCAGPPAVCYGFQFLEAHFYVEILFSYKTKFSVKAYGKAAKIIDPAAVMEFRNKIEGESPIMPSYEDVLAKLIITKDIRDNYWFYNTDYGIDKPEPKIPEQPTATTEESEILDGSVPKDDVKTTVTVVGGGGGSGGGGSGGGGSGGGGSGGGGSGGGGSGGGGSGGGGSGGGGSSGGGGGHGGSGGAGSGGGGSGGGGSGGGGSGDGSHKNKPSDLKLETTTVYTRPTRPTGSGIYEPISKTKKPKKGSDSGNSGGGGYGDDGYGDGGYGDDGYGDGSYGDGGGHKNKPTEKEIETTTVYTRSTRSTGPPMYVPPKKKKNRGYGK